MKRYSALILLLLLSATAGCAAQCVGTNCYGPHRASSLRAAHNLGSYSGALLGGANSRQAARHLRPVQTIRPMYNHWLDQLITGILGPAYP